MTAAKRDLMLELAFEYIERVKQDVGRQKPKGYEEVIDEFSEIIRRLFVVSEKLKKGNKQK